MGYDLDTVERLPNNEGYFRANIWGMRVLRGAMQLMGMTDDEFRVDYEHLDGKASPVAGIPYEKLTSNDPHLVHPDEIHFALNAYCKLSTDQRMILLSTAARDNGNDTPVVELWPWWQKWIAYLKLAERHGGFYVG